MSETQAEESYVRELPAEEGDWGRKAEVTLVSGRKVLVRAVPPFLLDRVQDRIPLPEPPIKIITPQMPGAREERLLDNQDPEYLRALEKATEARSVARTELFWNYGIVGVEPPASDQWKEELAFFDPDIEFRDGKIGRRLDYIQYVVVSTQEDFYRLQNSILLLTRPTDGELMRTMRSFRGDVQDNTSGALQSPEGGDSV